MAESFIGQLMLFAGNFASVGWIPCDGRVLPINQFTTLFSIVGGYYPGGNGSTTFALPDLRGRVPVGTGQGTGLQNYTLGQMAGDENVTLQTAQMPAHSHNMQVANTAGDSQLPAGAYLAETNDGNGTNYSTYNSSLPSGGNLANNAITAVGGSQGHPNLQPYIAMTWCICNQGAYPSRP